MKRPLDFATSTHPGVQAQLDRLIALSPGADILGLTRITSLLERVGDPHLRLPPVFHVAGTNGKGSTCAFLRAALEAQGRIVHVFTSPHLVRFNERIRVAGTLIADDALAAYLKRVLDAGEDIGASFFEVTTAAALLAFAEVPADAAVIEVGLGGRLDATNIIPAPAVCGIAQLGIDHQAFLGDTEEAIAAEKAGIAKPGTTLVTMRYPPSVASTVADVAQRVGATLFVEQADWRFDIRDGVLAYADDRGGLRTPLPSIAGAHQQANLALAIAMLRHQSAVAVSDASLARAALTAHWPARMQRLGDGPLLRLLPPGSQLWLDGGHNAAAADAVAAAARTAAEGRPIHLVLGMLANKDLAALLAPFSGLAASLTAVPITGHEHHAPTDIATAAQHVGIARTATAYDVPEALHALAAHDDDATGATVLILGSLYLAGEVLALNDETPA